MVDKIPLAQYIRDEIVAGRFKVPDHTLWSGIYFAWVSPKWVDPRYINNTDDEWCLVIHNNDLFKLGYFLMRGKDGFDVPRGQRSLLKPLYRQRELERQQERIDEKTRRERLLWWP